MESGIRIQKVLSDKGVLSRRKAEDAIRQNRVTVNGRPAKIGQKINPRRDLIAIDGKKVPMESKTRRIYLMLNKPRGYVTTTEDQHGRKTVIDLLDGVNQRVYPVGRLDLNSEGLLLLTNDGNLANSIMHPSGNISKTYRVTIRGDVSEEQLLALSTGVVLDDGYKTMPATVHVLTKEPNRTVLQITVTEGKNHLIRRMCASLNLELIRLKRIAVGPIKLGMLKPGKYRELKPAELIALRNAVKKAENKSEADRATKGR